MATPFATVPRPASAVDGSIAPSCPARVRVDGAWRRGDWQSPRARLASTLQPAARLVRRAVSPDRAPTGCASTGPAAMQETEDPYCFGPLLGELDLHLFAEGRHFELAKVLGAQCR